MFSVMWNFNGWEFSGRVFWVDNVVSEKNKEELKSLGFVVFIIDFFYGDFIDLEDVLELIIRVVVSFFLE